MPERVIDKPFLMPVEDIFSIKGAARWWRGVEKGICKVGEEMEIVGFTDTRKTVVYRRRDVQEAAGRRARGR